MTKDLSDELHRLLPGVIVSRPDASLYSVIDVRNIVDKDRDAREFALYCAREGKVVRDGKEYTLLVSPMSGFYATAYPAGQNPGRYQMRIAFVLTPEQMKMVPDLFVELLGKYQEIAEGKKK